MFQSLSISKLSTALLLATSLSFAGCASSGSSSNGEAKTATAEQDAGAELRDVLLRSKAHVRRTGEVYLMRGLLNVFSRGMDTMATKMRRKGLDAVSFNHSNWQGVARDIETRAKAGDVSYPIIIMGHSLGGNAAPDLANYLGSRGIKVSFVVTFDPTQTRTVGKNIGTVINYYLPNGKNKIGRHAGFTGKLSNVNVSNVPGIKHTNVEKNLKFQKRSIDTTIRFTKPTRKSRKKRSS